MKSHSSALGEKSLLPLIGKMSAPAVISMSMIAAYNLVDAIFIGYFVGELGLAALAANIPPVTIFYGFCLFIGVGGNTAISRSLGRGDVDSANKVLGVMILMVFMFGFLSVLLAFIGPGWILEMFGATDVLLGPSSGYLEVFLLGGPLGFFTVAINNVARGEGNAWMAMVSMVMGALVNIALDPLFIHYLGFGLRGAAWATVAGHLVSSTTLLWYLRSGRSSLIFRLANLRFNYGILKEISSVGLSILLINSSWSIIQGLVIRTLVQHGGETAVSVYGMCNRTIMFFFMPMFGVQAGILPILGYNYGARVMWRVRRTIYCGMVLCTVYLLMSWALIQMIPGFFIQAFTDDPVCLVQGIDAIKKISIAMPSVALTILIVTTFQAIGKAKYALFLSANRTIILIIPLLLYLPSKIGVDGVWFAFPIADSVAMIINLLFFLRVRQYFRDDEDSG